MEDVFNLRSLVKRDIKDISNICGSAHAGTDHETIVKAASRAINCHDDLVAALQAATDDYFLRADPDMINDYGVKLDAKMQAGLAALKKANDEQ